MKTSRKKIWCIVGICILCAALIAGSIAYFGFILPKQKEHKEHMQQVQQYRDNKMAQYRAENEKYAVVHSWYAGYYAPQEDTQYVIVVFAENAEKSLK